MFDNIDNVKLNKLDMRIFGSNFLLRNFTSNVCFLLVAAFQSFGRTIACMRDICLCSGLLFMMSNTC